MYLVIFGRRRHSFFSKTLDALATAPDHLYAEHLHTNLRSPSAARSAG